MVCLPCIFLPVCMFIYIKFIMPFVYRILPERWVTILDPWLYPTCPVEIPESKKEQTPEDQGCCSNASAPPLEEAETKKDL